MRPLLPPVTRPCSFPSSRLYQRYTFSLAPGSGSGGPLKIRTGITIAPAGGVWVRVHPR